MSRPPLAALLLLAAVTVAPHSARAETQRRCGWYHNPGPGNVLLVDADDDWWISRQGSAPAEGFEDAYNPAFDDRARYDHAGVLITDGASYGYSCACADGRFGPPGSGQVIAIDRLVERPLAACKTDPALPPP